MHRADPRWKPNKRDRQDGDRAYCGDIDLAIRYFVLPACGGFVTAATKLGFLPRSPLYRYVLLLQSTVPPAMSIGTIAQLFDVGEEECSIIFLWTHLVAALALTLWSTVFMSLVL